MIPARGVSLDPRTGTWAARTYGDAEAVVDGETRLTFTELAALAIMRRGPRSRRRRTGRPCRGLGPNSWEWIVTALAGILGAGACWCH